MPAETMHDGAQPSVRTEAATLAVPQEYAQPRNIRETIPLENLGDRSTKYNTPGVNPEDPYNAFHPEKVETAPASAETQEAVVEELTVDVDALMTKMTEQENRIAQLEAILRDTRELADAQPRRVRHTNGVTEELVKYKNGNHVTYEWEAVADQKPQYNEPLTAEVNAGWDDFEKERADGTIPSAEEAEATLKDTQVEDAPKPGKELELYNGDGKEVEATDTPETTEVSTTEEAAANEPAEEASDTPENEAETEEKATEKYALVETKELIQLQATLDEKLDEYARLTAKGRGSYAGHFLQDSKYLVKVPGLKWLADKANTSVDKKITESRLQYEKNISDIQVAITNAMMEQHGDDPDVMKSIVEKANKAAIDADLKLEMKILAGRMENSKQTNDFVNWWVSHDSLGWKFAKAGMVAGAALPIGLITGIGGAPLIGLAAAGAGGAVLGNFINKRRGNAVDSGNILNETNAQENSDADVMQKAAYRKQQAESGQAVSISELNKITEARTAAEKAKNRQQILSTTGAALAGASLGAGAGLGIRSAMDGAFGAPDATIPDAGDQSGDGGDGAGGEEEQAAPETPAIQGNEFTVENGGTLSQELVEFANANGHQLTLDQSYQLHQDLMNQFGTDYIDINGAGNDIYTEGGDVRLTEPGAAKWADGVGEYVQQWMAARGL